MQTHTVLSQNQQELALSSFNHASVQANLAFLLKRLEKYSVLTELSLDAGDYGELKPDVCIYSKRGLSRPRDILRMVEMPLLAIEILSPKQGTDDILAKFELYFQLGIQSCWLVDPATEIVAVYHAANQHTVYVSDAVNDDKLKLHLPLSEIFE